MSANPLRSSELIQMVLPAEGQPGSGTSYAQEAWSPASFEREQIRGLVRQVFFASIAQPVRQLVVSATEPEIEIGNLCRQIGHALSLETQESVAVVSRNSGFIQDAVREKKVDRGGESSPLRQISMRVRSNLWFVPEPWSMVESRQMVTNLSVYARVMELRREFEYSVVEGPSAGKSGEAAALGQLGDGLVLVLAAHSTRRATAKKIKEKLEASQVRLLGTVLSGRTFPVPESIYRRL